MTLELVAAEDLQTATDFTALVAGGGGSVLLGWLLWIVTRGRITIRSEPVSQLEAELKKAREDLEATKSRVAVAERERDEARRCEQCAKEAEREALERLVTRLEVLFDGSSTSNVDATTGKRRAGK